MIEMMNMIRNTDDTDFFMAIIYFTGISGSDIVL